MCFWKYLQQITVNNVIAVIYTETSTIFYYDKECNANLTTVHHSQLFRFPLAHDPLAFNQRLNLKATSV